MPYKAPSSLKGFGKALLKAGVGGGVGGAGGGDAGYMISLCTILWLSDGEVAGWCHRGSHHQEAWGSVLMVLKLLTSSICWRGGFLHPQNNSGNVHQTLLSRYFREEQSRGYGGGPVPGRPPWGPAHISRNETFRREKKNSVDELTVD